MITLTGTSTISSDAGTLSLTAATAITGTNQSLTFTGAGNVSVTGNITTGSGTLTKNGTGLTLLLGNGNSYTGGTTVSAGILQVGNNAVTTANSGVGAMSIQSGGTLAGTGTIRGNTTIAAGGILSPGDSTAALSIDQNGNLTITGSLTTTAGGTIDGQIRLNLSNPTHNDQTFIASAMSALDYYNTLDSTQKNLWNTVPTSTGHNYDYISVGGTLTLTSGLANAPTIAVTTTRSYGYGEIFNLFDWNMLTVGTFDANSQNDLLLPTLSNGLIWGY